MGDAGLRQLYMAKSVSELNDQVKDIPKASPKLLVKTAQRVLQEAQNMDKNKDEEKAYVLYMRYFSIVLTIQKQDEYKGNKKYYDALLDPKTTHKVIGRAEELHKSLDSRYEFKHGAKKAEKLAEEKRLVQKIEKENKKSAPIKAPKNSRMANGAAEDGFIPCEKLFSLSKEKVSSYLILDTRPRHLMMESQIKLPNVISVPEEILKPGLTAGKISVELEEESRHKWMSLRDKVDYLIIHDWCTDTLPFPRPITVLIDAMMKWDPNKQYKSQPLVLKGGYELWHLMYPMQTTNPRAISFNAKPESKPEPNLLNFEYPDLNRAFISTPSPRVSQMVFPDINDVQPSLTTAIPSVNRTLKPSVPSKEIDGRNNNVNGPQVNNNASIHEGSPVKKIPLGSKVNSWDVKDSNKALDSQPLEKVDNIPFIPSRSLKPKELLETVAAKKMEMDQEQQLLEESFKVEKDTMHKIKEMEETAVKKEQAQDEQSRTLLQQTEERLNEEIKMLKSKGVDMEERYNKIHKQNEELWKMVKLALSGNMVNVNAGPTSAPSNLSDTNKQEQEQLREQEDKRRHLEEQVEIMRRERKEKEKKLKEQAEREKKALEKAEAERREAEERKTKKEAELRAQRNKVNSGTGESYTTKLRDSPRSSPVRGGSNLKRSHSAFNLSQLGDDDNKENTPNLVSNFDRSLKPLNTPSRRNVNAARQRNFEPKYGNVGHARTGLKNLGNTCYMNSIIQCLNNTTALAKYFVEGLYSDHINPNSKYHGDVAEELGAVFRALWCGQYRSIAMWDLKNAVGRIHKDFQGYDQHDSHEFLIELMGWMHEDLNKITGKKPPMKEQNYDKIPDYIAGERIQLELRNRDDSIVCSLFQGLHRSVVDCGTCSHRSLTFEPFSVISLSFPSNGRCSLRELLDHYYKDSSVEYKCANCKRNRTSIRKLDIWKLPPVLILHLNRFEHDVLTKKQQNFVDFQLENMDMGKHTEVKSNRYTNFDLYGVCNHYGTMDGGHYTGFCKSSVNKKWYKFDDHEVYELGRENVRSSAAYLLFYEASNMNVKLNNMI